MKKLIILLSLGFIFSAHGKNQKKLDTIYANSTMTMTLFFPRDIKQGITGSDNFVFTYNREKEQNLGLLKAVKGNPSNLLVISADGNVYSYILKYSEHIDNPNRFITRSESIGNAKQIQKKEVITNKSISVNDSPDRLLRSCESFLKLPKEKNIGNREGGVKLSLKNLKYHGDNVYLEFEIENRLDIRFDFDYLNIFKVNGNKKRSASYQEIPLRPIYIHNKPKQMLPNTKTKIVYVVPKFNVDDNEKLEARLQELNTTRAVNLVWC